MRRYYSAMCDFCLNSSSAVVRVSCSIADTVQRMVDEAALTDRVDTVFLSPKVALSCVPAWGESTFVSLYGVKLRGLESVERNEAVAQIVSGAGDGKWNKKRKTFVLGKMCPFLNAQRQSVRSSTRTPN